ncbi:FtsL-like putative cell division protein [Hallella mizrahii]|uniref:FtsL-like putative cell division protein n=1 Tax=Hallella mizrahii TaxID=2606637 RepID=UPI001F20CDA4|nr:FtsL-like putative cell division protein [Hallella mizrahii]
MKKQEQISNNITDNKDGTRSLKDILGTPADDKANNTTATTDEEKPNGQTTENADKNEKKQEESLPSLKEVIEEQATEDEAPQSRLFSLKKILGGDILYTSFVRKQIWLFMLIGAFLIVYIGSRYSCQQDLIQIDKLQVKLKDAKYKALSSTSQLTEISRESNVIELLKNNKDSVLKIPSAPPYKIEVPEEGK